jgi:hypothetical protein
LGRLGSHQWIGRHRQHCLGLDIDHGADSQRSLVESAWPWRRHDNGNVNNGRRMSSGRLLSASELAAIVDSKGQLHDCVVSLTWVRGTTDRLVIHTNDIEANFRGLPEYRGKRSGEITLTDALEIESSLEEGRLNIYEASIESDGARGRLTLRFWPYGSLVASFASATFIESDR